jgi:hypothetical protein
MKIGDIEIGKQYGALDNPKGSRYSSYVGDLPRQVEVLEVVTVPERRYSGYAFGPSKTVNVRKLKVKFLGESLIETSRYGRGIATAEKDSTLVIETRQVVAPWENLSKDVTSRIELEQKSDALRDRLEARLDLLIGREDKGPKRQRRKGFSYASVNKYSGEAIPELRISGEDVETLLAFAERGKEAEDYLKAVNA